MWSRFGVAAIDMQHGRRSEWVAKAACVVLAALIVGLLARLFWAFVPGGDDASMAPPRTAALAASPVAVAISKWHLFGAASTRAVSNRDAPTTTLALRLRGTLADADPRAGIAVIADDVGNERAWRVGEQVVPGVVLDEVHADRVVLLHGGAQEVLGLVREETSVPPPVAPTAGPRAAALRNTSPASTGPAPPTFAPPNIAHGAADWQQTMDKIGGGSIDTLAKRVQVTPVLDNGRIAGVRVSTAGDTALMARLGLRPSDIVTAVNGIPVDSVARGQQILDSLGSATDVRVTVTRDGVPSEVTMKLR